jgi:hypothetical protein
VNWVEEQLLLGLPPDPPEEQAVPPAAPDAEAQPGAEQQPHANLAVQEQDDEAAVLAAANLYTDEEMRQLAQDQIYWEGLQAEGNGLVSASLNVVDDYRARLGEKWCEGGTMTMAQLLFLLVEAHKQNSNTTDTALDRTLTILSAAVPSCILPPSYHIVKGLLRVAALQECDYHVCDTCHQHAWRPLPKEQWVVSVDHSKEHLCCPVCHASRFILVQRPGGHQEAHPRMVCTQVWADEARAVLSIQHMLVYPHDRGM